MNRLQAGHWSKGLIVTIAFIVSALAFGQQHVEASTLNSNGLEARLVEVVDDMMGSKRVGGLASNGDFYLYASSSARLYRSEDGVHWNRIRNNNSGYQGRVIQLIWDGKQFVLLQHTRVLSSPDGVEWSDHTPVHPNRSKEYIFNDIIHNNGQYVILAQDRDREFSTFYLEGDNTIFVGNSLSELSRAETRNFARSLIGERSLEYLTSNGSVYVAGGDTSAYSYDGKVWHGGGALYTGYNVIWDGKRFVHANSRAVMAVDATGTNVQEVYEFPRGTDNRQKITTIAHNGQSYIAAGYTGASSTTIAYSKDGVKWEAVKIGDRKSDIHHILPTPYGYVLAGDVIWYVSEMAMDSPSNWAAEGVEQAKAYNILTNETTGFYQGSISRKDFSGLAVKLYEAWTNLPAEEPQVNPFRDTANHYVLKANKLGMIKGQQPDRFAPASSISRQDMAVILLRTLQAAGLNPETATSQWKSNYVDLGKVASYAQEALRFMNQEGIINGKSSDQLDPAGTATREESIVMAVRLYERFKDRIAPNEGSGSFSDFLFIPTEEGVEELIAVERLALNFDGRFIWHGEIINNGQYYFPLSEFSELLGVQTKWDRRTNTLHLSKTEQDLVRQPSTGIRYDDVVRAQARYERTQLHKLKYSVNGQDYETDVYDYQGKVYFPIGLLDASMKWKSGSTVFSATHYYEIKTEGVYSTTFFPNKWFSSDFHPIIRIGENYLLRHEGGKDQLNVTITQGDASSVTITPTETGYMITGVRRGSVELRVDNLVNNQNFIEMLTVE